MGKPLIKPLSLSHIKLPPHITIKEIICECDLNWAGNKLKNCLNDPNQKYAEKIKNGKSRVFIIMTNKSYSAIEFYPLEELIYKEKQLLSSCNKKPSLYHRVVGDILKNELNIQILKEGYEKRIKYYNDIILLNNGLLQTVSDEKTDKNEVGYNIGRHNDEIIFGIPEDGEDQDPLIWVDPPQVDDFLYMEGEEGEEGIIEIDEEEENIIIDELTTTNTLGDLFALRDLRDEINQQQATEIEEEDTSRDIDTLFT